MNHGRSPNWNINTTIGKVSTIEAAPVLRQTDCYHRQAKRGETHKKHHHLHGEDGLAAIHQYRIPGMAGVFSHQVWLLQGLHLSHYPAEVLHPQSPKGTQGAPFPSRLFFPYLWGGVYR